MKSRYIPFLLILLFSLCLLACSSYNKTHIAELKIEIPGNLADNKSAVAFIENNQALINQYSNIFHNLIDEFEPYSYIPETQLTPADKKKLGSIMMVFMANMGQFTVEMAEMDNLAKQLKNELSEQEVESLLVVTEIFNKHINQIGESYASFGIGGNNQSRLLQLYHK